MASKIRVLDENTINKIAAGEVIENPASVVKELVENSIDAGSTEICIEIIGGGRQLIRITDNGSGMNADDAVLCLERHATSKIRDVEDIQSILTMGFRGEAVPSIASISKFTIITSPLSQDVSSKGTMVIVEGGQIIKCCSAERSHGTTIEVKSLFFNVPVRKKFQKSPTYDASEILKIVNSLALGQPHIKFTLINDHKMVLSTPLTSSDCFLEGLKERVSTTLGADFLSAMIPVDQQKEDCHIRGLISTPVYHRNNRSGQSLFINQRPVFSPLISALIREGYGTSLPTHRYPAFVLHLTLPGSLLDVNVHPQKREVRLRQEQILRELILSSVEKSLQGTTAPQIPEVNFLKEDPWERNDWKTPKAENFNFQPPIQTVLTPNSYYMLKTRNEVQDSALELPYTTLSATSLPPSPKIIGTLPNYIIAFIQEGEKERLCFLDQQAAHQKILYESLSHTDDKKLEVQSLLIPVSIELTHSEAATLQEHLQELNELGISIKEFGKNAFLIDAIPTFFKQANIQEVILEILQDLSDLHGIDLLKNEKSKRLAFSVSRKAISDQKCLTHDEAKALVNRLMQCKNPYQCPQGNQILVKVSSEELKRHFFK